MFDVTTWTAHATREPQSKFLRLMDERWRKCPSLTDADCIWHKSPTHALAMLHADRAAHRRRLRTQFFGEGECDLVAEGHGFSPMSDLMPHDQYGPELLNVQHTGNKSPLAEAMRAAKADPNLAAVAAFTEEQFVSVDSYLAHSATDLQPEIHGAVIPFVLLEDGEDQRTNEVRDLLHVNGFMSYEVDLSNCAKDPIGTHRELAVVMEDAFDWIAGIKADAAARILLNDPRWPIVVLQGAAA